MNAYAPSTKYQVQAYPSEHSAGRREWIEYTTRNNLDTQLQGLLDRLKAYSGAWAEFCAGVDVDPETTLMMLMLIRLQILSGAFTPQDSVPEFIQRFMLAAPNTHFVTLRQTVLFRGAGFNAVWPPVAALAFIGSVLFVISLGRFRRTLGSWG